MAEIQRIEGNDGTVSLISDSYAPFGELPVTATRPEIHRNGWSSGRRRSKPANASGARWTI
jgi:hypothetical protein